jgi:hypothetical protein
MKAFVYMWQHRDGRFYVGSHQGTELDGYICSSTIVIDSIRQNPDDWQRQILARGDVATMRLIEQQILRELFTDELCLNQAHGDGSDIVFKDRLTSDRVELTPEAHKILELLKENYERQ